MSVNFIMPIAPLLLMIHDKFFDVSVEVSWSSFNIGKKNGYSLSEVFFSSIFDVIVNI